MTIKYLITSILMLFFIASNVKAQKAIYSSDVIHHPLVAAKGMVASQHKLATKAGLDILKQGGNAIDAAIAAGMRPQLFRNVAQSTGHG